MAGDIYETEHVAAGQRRVGVAQVQRYATRFLFRQPVSVHAGERLHQRSLAVVDVACCANDHSLQVERLRGPSRVMMSGAERRPAVGLRRTSSVPRAIVRTHASGRPPMLTWGTAYLISEWLVRIVMLVYVPQRRSPASARAWLLLIFFLPALGLVLYALIGRA